MYIVYIFYVHVSVDYRDGWRSSIELQVIAALFD